MKRTGVESEEWRVKSGEWRKDNEADEDEGGEAIKSSLVLFHPQRLPQLSSQGLEWMEEAKERWRRTIDFSPVIIQFVACPSWNKKPPRPEAD
jgi:hypothetical protein